ncbi:hypothetical protein IFM61606_05910 [Aspergillus udagawae]|uniref:Uncharacterized protein n=1 Tax=Aspergillus udagawae TaxID=91492 RepID=A0ABQ1APD2_9EURO|nr:hypothetical protein IFM51744_06040 [Aspergillus udagawae]GFF85631.1 hypothetical protein IFM53868_04544 [Aspergillus udagawae]GFG06260.1 hypothetical protein IFM5058_02832 [Aspergillus udagawae]GFG25948.1 hypothetical protein IFM61606_05910 [Aspergillus udagawae]
MHAYIHLLLNTLLAANLAGQTYASPYRPPVDQINLPEPVNPVTPWPNLNDLISEVTRPIEDDHSASGTLGLHYGECYYIENLHGDRLGSDGGTYSYYKFGNSKRIFQVWYSRGFPYKDGRKYSVPDGGEFYLWDPKGSSVTNGGSWVATNLGGNTYPGFYSYYYYLRLKGRRDDARASEEAHAMGSGYPVTLGIAKVEPPNGIPNFKGLTIENDYLVNRNNEDTVDVRFHEVSCPWDGSDD